MIERILAPPMAALRFVSFIGTVAGFNTIEGAGKDVEQGGKAIKDEAREKR